MCGPRACIRICAAYRERNGRCRADRLDWLSHGAELGKAAKTLARDRAFESLHSCRPRIVTSSLRLKPLRQPPLGRGLIFARGSGQSRRSHAGRSASSRIGGRKGASRATLPNAQIANSSISGRLGAVASRSPPGGARAEVNLVCLTASWSDRISKQFHRDTELGKGAPARPPVIRRGPLPRAPKSVVCGTLSKRPSHLLAL